MTIPVTGNSLNVDVAPTERLEEIKSVRGGH